MLLGRGEDRNALEFPDEVQYWQMGESLAAGDGLRDELDFRATRMPLYPAMLAPFAKLTHGVVAAKVLHWLIGACVALTTAGLAAEIAGARVGIVAGMLVALDPFLVFFSSLLLTETPFLLGFTGLWWALWPAIAPSGGTLSARRWLAVGLLAALCVYLRESSLGLVLLVLAFVAVCRRFERRTVLGALLATVTIVVALIPWAARNRQLTGEWCWLTHRGGISLYDGVRPGADGRSDLGDIKQGPEVVGLDEVAWNRYFLDESIRAIRNEPRRIARLAVVKLGRMWNPIPNAESYRSTGVRIVAGAWTIPIFALAAAGVWVVAFRRRAGGARVVLFLALPALYLSALHALFVGSVRYRLGAMPFIEILAAVTLVALVDRLWRRTFAEKTDRVR